MSRRQSVADVYGTVEVKIRETMGELSQLWDEVTMSDSMRVKRVDSAFAHIIHLCDEMLEGERQMVSSLKNTIREDLSNVQKMRLELEMDGFERPIETPENSIALMRHLQTEIKRLEGEFNRRHEEQKTLIEKIEILKKRLDDKFEFEHETHMLFPVVAFEKYTEECGHMETTLRQRYSTIESLQSDLKQWAKLADGVQNYVKQDENLKELLQRNVDSDDFEFSQVAVDTYKSYHDDLKPLYEAWLEDIEFRWSEKYNSLSELWEKCLVPLDDRHFEQQFEPHWHTEEHLRRMDEEVKRLSDQYAACKVVYDLVDRWMVAWNEKLGIEEKRKMPDYYKKVNVLPDNKRERELINLMGGLEKEIRAGIKKYEDENEGKHIMVQGMQPMEFLRVTKEEHQKELKIELQMKKEQKTMCQSPRATPTPRSQKRPNPYFRTPKSAAPAVKRLNTDVLPMCMSPGSTEAISFITPTRRQATGPKTSSPKETISRTTTPMSRRNLMTPNSNRPLSRRNQ